MCFTSTNSKPSSCVLLLTLLCCSFLRLPAQNQVDRFEIELATNEIDLTAISAAEKGLIIFRRLLETPIDRYEFTHLDTSLNVVWERNIEVAKELALAGSLLKDDILFLLFRSVDFSTANFQIASIKVENGEHVVSTVTNVIPFNPTEFVITNEAAFMGGYFNYRPLVLYFSFLTQKSHVLPGFYNDRGELTHISPNKDGTTDIIVSADNVDKKKSLWIRNYSSKGDLIKTTILQPEPKKNLIFGRSIQTNDGKQMVVGVYGRYKEYSRGFFIAGINETGEYGVKYYNFAELQRFFNYMKAEKEDRVMGKIERRKIKGKKIKFNYRFVVHEIIPYQDQYIMLGEAFYPQYSYAQGTEFGIYSPLMYSHSFSRGGYTLIGYHYTHAVVIGFNDKGELKWDNSFEINNVETTSLKQFVKARPLDDRIILQYAYDNQIHSKIIKDAEVLEGKVGSKIKLRFEDDILVDKKSDSGQIAYWYGEHLFTYGVQNIKNFKEIKVPQERRVFFVNKISY